MNTETGEIISLEKMKARLKENPEAVNQPWVEVPPEFERELHTMNRAQRRQWYKTHKLQWKPLNPRKAA